MLTQVAVEATIRRGGPCPVSTHSADTPPPYPPLFANLLFVCVKSGKC
jgi:hypothetical protein